MKNTREKIFLAVYIFLFSLVVISYFYANQMLQIAYSGLDSITRCQLSGGMCELVLITGPPRDFYEYWLSVKKITTIGVMLFFTFGVGLIAIYSYQTEKTKSHR